MKLCSALSTSSLLAYLTVLTVGCRQGFGTTDAGQTVDGSVPDASNVTIVGFGERCDQVAIRCEDGLSCTGSTCSCVTELAANEHHTCVLEPTGDVRCSGDNTDGQLGQGMIGGSSSSPVLVKDLPAATHVSVGAFHGTSVTEAGELWVWGRVDNETPASRPYRIRTPGETIVGVASGGFHACMLTAAERVYCFGQNSSGQLGAGETGVTQTEPVRVSTLSDVIALTSGNEHSCAIVRGGDVMCWGLNTSGQIGDGFVGGVRSTPTKVAGLANAVEVAAGDFHTCARGDDSVVRCWGKNNVAQLGRGLAGPSDGHAAEVATTSDIVGIASGDDTSCSISHMGEVQCWGSNSSGQLGIVDAETVEPSPLPFPILEPAIAVDLGRAHVCVLQVDGGVFCAGRNDVGQFGNGDSASSSSPTPSLHSCSD